MILDRLPDRPGKQTTLKFLGYWHSVAIDPKTKLPNKTGIEFDRYAERFESLPVPSDFIDETWDPAERALVLAYLKGGKTYESWRGFSWCRLGCTGCMDMGTTDRTDGTYVWPEGFSHYVEKHAVKPPQEFIDHVRSKIG
jgi:hypothetical protein